MSAPHRRENAAGPASTEPEVGLLAHLSPTSRRLVEDVRKQRERRDPPPRAARLMYGIILMLPVAFVLGLGEFVWPIFVLPLVVQLAKRGRIYVPRLMAVWLVFYCLVLVSTIPVFLDGELLALSPIFMHASAAVLFLYVFNAPVDELPDRFVVKAVALYWVIVLIGGILGLILTTRELPSVGAWLLANATSTADRLVDATLVQFADPLKFGEGAVFGLFNYRPKGFFAFTNHWGSAFVLFLPAALIVRWTLPTALGRRLGSAALLLGLVPFVVSRNRAAWLSLLAVGVYAIVRLWRPYPRLAKAIVGALVVVVAVSALSPLRSVVAARVEDEGSNSYRSQQYDRSLEIIEESPWIGFGTVQIVPDQNDSSREIKLGVDSQILSVLVKHGIPAAVLFLVWVGALTWMSRKLDTVLLLVGHLMLVIAVVQAPSYGLLPHRWHIIMFVAGAMMRHLYLTQPRPAGALVLVMGSGSGEWRRRGRLRSRA